MTRRNQKHVLLTLVIGFMTLAWVGTASGWCPGCAGLVSGFQASEKGFPGWSEYDQNQETDALSATTVLQGEQGFMPYEGFNGAQDGQYPGHRPAGK